MARTQVRAIFIARRKVRRFVVACKAMRFTKRAWKLFAALLLVGLVGTGLMMLTLAEIHEEILEPDSVQREGHIQDEIHEETSSGMTRVMFALTWIGSPQILVPAIPVFAALLWWRRLHHAAILLLVSTAGAGVLSLALKLHFRRVRPDVPWALAHELTFSFPSGHSVFAVVLYGTLVYLGMRHLPRVWERVGIVIAALALVFGIGYSRIYLGVHYPSDVAAGYLVGTVWLIAVMGSDWYVRRSTAAGKVAGAAEER